MKIKRSQLKQIIKEEVKRVLNERQVYMGQEEREQAMANVVARREGGELPYPSISHMPPQRPRRRNIRDELAMSYILSHRESTPTAEEAFGWADAQISAHRSGRGGAVPTGRSVPEGTSPPTMASPVGPPQTARPQPLPATAGEMVPGVLYEPHERFLFGEPLQAGPRSAEDPGGYILNPPACSPDNPEIWPDCEEGF